MVNGEWQGPLLHAGHLSAVMPAGRARHLGTRACECLAMAASR